MTRSARILTALYTAVTLWLAYCTITTWGDVPLWVSITMLAAGVAAIVAGLREAEHADELRQVRVQLERATRPTDTTPAISPDERARFDELVAGLDLDDAA